MTEIRVMFNLRLGKFTIAFLTILIGKRIALSSMKSEINCNMKTKSQLFENFFFISNRNNFIDIRIKGDYNEENGPKAQRDYTKDEHPNYVASSPPIIICLQLESYWKSFFIFAPSSLPLNLNLFYTRSPITLRNTSV